MLWYMPYNKFLPTKQAKLLSLWDELGVPHEESKQLFGSKLTIIGLDVDPNDMTISIPADKLSDLISSIRDFARPGTRHSLQDFQRLAGWMNWALNVFPLLRPGLCTLFDKIRGKSRPFQLIWVSVTLTRELLWFADRATSLPPVHVMLSNAWDTTAANLVLYTDACLQGLAFWCPSLLRGFQYPSNDPSIDCIFFWEALAIVSALHWALTSSFPPPRCVLIYTDNSNSVDLFTTLRARPLYNPLLLTTADLLTTFGADLRVLHVPGHLNSVADALSRFHNANTQSLAPGLHITPFIPPRLTLGADAS
jgi:hypothetical protein